ncbi:Cytosolic sulfotransferase 5 [Acorus gramineus]|uniref:Sulfotransferase n=1 Tax=Acorus gramineus TaxID=55184 RepID=A0AAV9A3W8_ACOGR|nr:Cytosolic sulfotransferase 5 [Acorus gramineus]
MYHGFWYSSFVLNGIMSVQDNFKADPSDVLIASSPKSGTTWLKALVFALLNRNAVDQTSKQVMHSLNPHEYVPFLEVQLYAHSPPPRLLATHIPYSALPESTRGDPSCRIVYISRDIKDVFVSFWHFLNDGRHDSHEPFLLEEAFESYSDGVSPYGPIWDHQSEYWKASIERPQSVIFLKYEDMMEDPVNGVKRLAKFLGCPFSVEEEEGGVVDEIVKVCSFEYLKNLEVNKEGEIQFGKMKFMKWAFFHRGVVGDSKRYLTPEMIERLNMLSVRMTCSSGSSP